MPGCVCVCVFFLPDPQNELDPSNAGPRALQRKTQTPQGPLKTTHLQKHEPLLQILAVACASLSLRPVVLGLGVFPTSWVEGNWQLASQNAWEGASKRGDGHVPG